MIDWDAAVLGPVHDVFGNTTVSYQPTAGGVAFSVTGIFDRGFRHVVPLESGDEAIATAQPTLGVRRSLFPADPVQGDLFTIQSVTEASLQPLVNRTYIVREPRADGRGEVRLMLNLVSKP